MGTELRTKTTLTGREYTAIYVDGRQVGRIEKETTLSGREVEVTYDSGGNSVCRTTHDTTIAGTPIQVTRDNLGHLLSETHPSGFFDSGDKVIREKGSKVGYIHTGGAPAHKSLKVRILTRLHELEFNLNLLMVPAQRDRKVEEVKSARQVILIGDQIQILLGVLLGRNLQVLLKGV